MRGSKKEAWGEPSGWTEAFLDYEQISLAEEVLSSARPHALITDLCGPSLTFVELFTTMAVALMGSQGSTAVMVMLSCVPSCLCIRLEAPSPAPRWATAGAQDTRAN